MKVVQKLLDMGFTDDDVRAAIAQHGFNAQACVDYLTNGRDMADEPEVEDFKNRKLAVHQPVWLHSNEENDWVPGQIVSITKELVSVIFGDNDFRWFEKESPMFRTVVDKPERLYPDADPMPEASPDIPMPDAVYRPPEADEIDYKVQFDEPVLGLELYSDEEGYNCIVGRCVSDVSQSKVTPGSHIVQVNNDWLSGLVFEDIRDAVKTAARSPPLVVTFRIKRQLYARAHHQSQTTQSTAPGPNVTVQVPNTTQKSADYPIFSPFPASPAVSPFLNQTPTPMQHAPTQPAPDKMDAEDRNYYDEADEKQARPPVHELPQQNDEETDDQDLEPPLTLEECHRLSPGDEFDHRDDVGRFVLASVIDKRGTNVKIHYNNWNSKWDTWCDFAAETQRFCRPRSISRRPNTRFRGLKINDYVDINPTRRHPGWKVGRIRRMDKYSGQVQIIYKFNGEEYLWWTHLNNRSEVARFMTEAPNAQQEYQELRVSEAIEQPNKQTPIPPAPRRKLPPKPTKRHSQRTASKSSQPPQNVHRTGQSIIQIASPSYPTSQPYRFDMYGNQLKETETADGKQCQCGVMNEMSATRCSSCQRQFA